MNDAGAMLQELLATYQPFILALLLAQGRMIGFLQQFPLFSYTGIQGQIRAIFALAISYPIAVMIEPEVRQLTVGNTALIIALLAKEVALGFGLGTVLAIPFYGVQAAGDFIDHQRGASMVNQTDPVNAAESTTSGTILLLTSLAIFVVAGGLFVIVQVIYDSYQFWPATSLMPNTNIELFSLLGFSLNLLIQIGLIIAGPVLIVLFMVDLVLAFGSRAAGRIQLDDMSQGTKNVIVILLIPFYGIFLSQYVQGDWRALVAFVRGAMGLP